MLLVQRICCAITLAGISAITAAADQKTLTEYGSGDGPKSRVLLLRKDNLQRTEMNAVQAVITRPEVIIYLDLQRKTFQKTPVGGAAVTAVAAPGAAPAANTETRKGGLVKSRVEIEDTGERKQIFGYEARRLKMKSEMVAGPDTCHPGEMRMETDGWYIDLKQTSEGKADGGASSTPGVNGGCKDEYQSEYSGKGKPGFPIEYTSNIWQNGQGPHVTSMKVLEFSEETLSPALFEIPEGFTDRQQAAIAAVSPASEPTSSAGNSAASSGGVLVGVAPVASAPVNANTTLASHLSAESVASIALGDNSLETARKAGVGYLLKSEQVAKEQKKRGGMFGKLSNALSGQQVELRYTLIAVSDGRELLQSSAISKAGGSGFGTALGIAQVAAPAAGYGRSGHIAQAAVQTAATVSNGSMSGLPVAGLLGNHSYAAYSGMMDPNLQSLAYMGRYSPSMAAAQAAGMAANAVATSAVTPQAPAVDEGADGTLDNAMRLTARAVRDRLKSSN